MLIFTAGWLVFNGWREFNATMSLFPQNSRWGKVDVSGLHVDEARQRVAAYYLAPLEIHYGENVMIIPAEETGFQLDFEGENQKEKEKIISSFWAFLWNGTQSGVEWEVEFSLDEKKLRRFLQAEIAARYDIPASLSLPIAGSSRFTIPTAGRSLDIENSLIGFRRILEAPDQRLVELVIHQNPPEPVDAAILKAVLIDELKQAAFNGIAEIYLSRLKDEEIIHFAVQNGQEVPFNIAFSAASTIKIPILLSALMEVNSPFPDDLINQAERMMVYSENPPADRIMETYIGSTLAPLQVTENLQKAGFQNTFLAGYFYLGAPLLQRFETEANQRSDINLAPDVYNQTTAGDMGLLLEEIYHCAQEGKGRLAETFPEQITPEKCFFIIEMMKRNRIGVLAQAGLPEGTAFAHKHGWSEESDGFLHTISDVGIVFGPQSDYVMVIFLYDPVQLLFEPANALMAKLSQRIFNAWNPDYQVEWAFGNIRYR
ncbi:MAG: serine hydrolase [Chloroflexota bacterium]